MTSLTAAVHDAPPALVGTTASSGPDLHVAHDCAALTINYNTATQTLRNVQSLLTGRQVPAAIYVLDNASESTDFRALRDGLPTHTACPVYLMRSDVNLGFAGGSNALLAQALQMTSLRYFLLLNNDAVALPELLLKLRLALEQGAVRNIHMAGARMHRLAAPDEVDTLGIAVYASLMPADRKTLDDRFVGPTGGCAMYSRTLLQAVHEASGYWFDHRYFCYCEDTDFTLRARLLGFEAVFVNETLALHEGQASSNNAPSDFIAYHGLRNSIWMHAKLLPAGTLARYGIFLLLAHLATVGRYVLTGRLPVLWRVYRDAWRQRQPFLAERKRWQLRERRTQRCLQALITPRFYRKGYLGLLLRQWRQGH